MGSCSSLAVSINSTNETICEIDDPESVVPTEDESATPKGLGTNRFMHNIQAHGEEINCISVSPDASLIVSGSDDCSVRVWSVDRFDCVREFLGHSDYITCVVFAGGEVLSGSGDMTIRKWDLISGDCVFVSITASTTENIYQ